MLEEVCRKGEVGGKIQWWWNIEVKETILRKKCTHKAMCSNNIEKTKDRYESMKNKTKQADSRAKRKKSGAACIEKLSK